MPDKHIDRQTSNIGEPCPYCKKKISKKGHVCRFKTGKYGGVFAILPEKLPDIKGGKPNKCL